MDTPYDFKFMAIITTPAGQLIATDGWSLDVRNTSNRIGIGMHPPISIGMHPSWSNMPMFRDDDDGQPSGDIHIYLPFTPDVHMFLETLKEPLRNGEAQIDLWFIGPFKFRPDDEPTMLLHNYHYEPGPQSELDVSEWKRQLMQNATDDYGIDTARIRIQCDGSTTCRWHGAPPKRWLSGEIVDLPEAVRVHYNLHDARDAER